MNEIQIWADSACFRGDAGLGAVVWVISETKDGVRKTRRELQKKIACDNSDVADLRAILMGINYIGNKEGILKIITYNDRFLSLLQDPAKKITNPEVLSARDEINAAISGRSVEVYVREEHMALQKEKDNQKNTPTELAKKAVKIAPRRPVGKLRSTSVSGKNSRRISAQSVDARKRSRQK